MTRLAPPLVPLPPPGSPWGPRGDSFHNGLDIPCALGTELHAMTNGTVVNTLFDQTEASGIAVIVVDDSGRTRWSFSHCLALLVAIGDRVRRGAVIAYSGNSGNVSPPRTSSCPSCGAHVHVRVDVDGVNVDPQPLIYRPRSGAFAWLALAGGFLWARSRA